MLPQLLPFSLPVLPSLPILPFRHNVYSYEGSEERVAAEIAFDGVDSSRPYHQWMLPKLIKYYRTLYPLLSPSSALLSLRQGLDGQPRLALNSYLPGVGITGVHRHAQLTQQ